MKNKKIQQRLLKSIPGGAHTYSRGYDQFPSNAPEILTKGKGAYSYDQKGKKYLDYGMALRAVNIGYSEKDINNAAIKEINNREILAVAPLAVITLLFGVHPSPLLNMMEPKCMLPVMKQK